jgi:hypothetical protein
MLIFSRKVIRAYVVIARNNFPCPLLNMRPIEAHTEAEDVSFLRPGYGCFPCHHNESGTV